MKLVLVTSVFALRKSRPLDYYLVPAVDLLQDLKNTEIEVFLFTNLNHSYFPSASNITIISPTLDELICEIWSNPDWREIYRKALADRSLERFEEKRIVELISIWLGKFKMMEIASKSNADKILWQDSGIRMGKIFHKDFRKYKKCTINPKIYIQSVETFLSEKPLAFMESERVVNPYHGIDMTKYGPKEKYIRGGFIFMDANEVHRTKNSIFNYWNELISNGDYGTEENPLTMYYWERRSESLKLSYDKWLSLFNIGNISHAKVIL